MKTPGAKKVTATSFAKVRHLQTNSTSTPAEIKRLVGHSETTQRSIKHAGTWKHWQELRAAHQLKAKTARTNAKLAVRKQIIERNTKAKAARIAVEHVVVTPADLSALREEFEATKRQLSKMIREDRKQRETTIARMIDDALQERFTQTGIVGGMVTNDLEPDPAFMIADAEHNRPRKHWFGGRR